MTRFFRAAASAALCLFSLSFQVLAQDIQLRSHDGSIELSGELIGFDGENYRIDSIFGPLSVAAEGVRCEGPGCPDLQDYVAEIRFQGAPAITQTLLPALIDRFASSRGMRLRREIGDGETAFVLIREADESEAARFILIPSTTDAGFDALMSREADIAVARRVPNAEERAAARAADQGEIAGELRSRVLGLDALVALVAPSNPVGALSLEDLAQVLAGEITNWSDLGGPDAPIALHLPEETSGLGQDIEARVMAPFDLSPSPEVTRHATARALSSAVTRDPFALGIGSYSNIGNAHALALRGACGFQQQATAAALKSGDYPLTAPLLIYLPVRRMPQLGREFFAFFESQEADRVIRRSGFVNQAITAQELQRQGARLSNAILAAGEEIELEDLQEMAESLVGAERLSATFRFGDGTTRLDAASLSVLSRLARAIERGAYDGRELVLVGFSDGQGGASGNLRLARGRAEAVRLALIEAAEGGDLNRVRLSVEAYGEALPMACDESEAGRAVNRRVEVWLR